VDSLGQTVNGCGPNNNKILHSNCIYSTSQVLLRRLRSTVITTLPMVTMIPASSSRDPIMAYRYPLQYRHLWVPSVGAQPQSSIPSLETRIVECAREDEICAAKVLLDLSPKEQKHVHNIVSAPQQDATSAFTVVWPDCSKNGSIVTVPVSNPVPYEYLRRWQNLYSTRNGQVISSVARPTDISEPSSSEDESSSAGDSSIPMPASESTHLHSGTGEWHLGSASLALAEDVDVLSRLHCFMRRYCVEVFTALPDDVSLPRYGKSHGVKVICGQVGIRCLYCKHRKPGMRPERAVCFPSSLRNIYHSIETWQRRHSVVCNDIPAWVRQTLIALMESAKSRAGGRRQYWEDSARRLGLVDTAQGIRFSRKPGDLAELDADLKRKPLRISKPIVHRGDREFVTDYLYLLMDQMETCQFAEEDRSGGRSKIKDNVVGFLGMQCKHCQGKAGFGRYFPTTASALALANSDRNILNHLQKCPRCPDHIKLQLLQLSKKQAHSKNRRGLRKMFFQRVWSRIHEEDT
jgi:hypothetical protein